jgi:hypothetical protein
VRTRGRSPPERLALFVELEARLLKVSDDPLGELPPGIVRHPLLYDSAQQVAAPRDGQADREDELVAEAAVIHRADVLLLFSPVIARLARRVKAMLGTNPITGRVLGPRWRPDIGSPRSPAIFSHAPGLNDPASAANI